MTDIAQRPEQPERRRADRIALRLGATLREPNRGRVEARLIDVSTHGCRVEAISAAAPGSWLWLNVAGLETQYCRVVWRCGEFVGLEFEVPLAETTLDRLLDDHHRLTEGTIAELREIAVRAHRLAASQADSDVQTLADLSRRCAVEAVVEGFRLGEAGRPAEPSSSE